MIGYLRGEILENSLGKMLIGVGDKVGYLVSVPQNANYDANLIGQTIELFIYTHVREDSLDLYGFSSRMEKELFLTLLNVNGIGPRSALGILSAVSPESLIEAIMTGDQQFLTQIPGIGKKTAERVVVELRDSVRKKVESGGFVPGQKSQSKALSSLGGVHLTRLGVKGNLEILRDAKAALVGLGYRENDVHSLLERVLEESEPRPQRAEELIKTALRQLV